MTRRVLVVDDESGIREALAQLLEYEGYEVRAVANGTAALSAFPEFAPHLTFLDVKMQGLDGLETLSRLRSRDPAAVVVMISGHASIADAVEATQRGAYDILEKPLDTERVLVTLRNALGHLTLRDENQRLREVVERAPNAQALHAVALRRQQAGRHDDSLVLFEEAAEKGHAPAMTALARLYDPNGFRPGQPFRSPDPRAAARYYRDAAQRGDAAADAPRAALKAWLEEQAPRNQSAADALKEFWP